MPSRSAVDAERLAALAPLVDVDACTIDHVGCTAVPGPATKPFVDLQVRVPSIPEPDVRLSASPFGRRTVAVRDRLRAAHQRVEQDPAAAHAADADDDDHPRGESGSVRAATSGARP